MPADELLHARAYVGAIPELRDKDQRDLCCESAKLLGVKARHVSMYGPERWDDYLRDIRSDEVCIVASLLVLKERAGAKGRIGRLFERKVRELERRSLFVFDAMGELKDENTTGMRSTDDGWVERVDQVHGKITHGRRLDPEKAAEMASSKPDVAPGVVATFRSRKRAADRERVKVLWTTKAYANAGEALKAIGEEFGELEGASDATIRRITDVGRNGKKTPAARRQQST